MFYVYVLASRQRVKIGVARDIGRRVRALEAKHGPLALVHSFTCTSSPDSFRLEKALHWHFRREHIALEWFGERVLETIRDVDRAAILRAYAGTRVYEVRLDRGDVQALEAQGLTVEDAVIGVARQHAAIQK